MLGHSSVSLWKKRPHSASFALLNKLSPGDPVKIVYADGQTFTFVVRKSLIFNPLEAENPELIELEKGDRPAIFLVTCYPPGVSSKRITIKAELL